MQHHAYQQEISKITSSASWQAAAAGGRNVINFNFYHHQLEHLMIFVLFHLVGGVCYYNYVLLSAKHMLFCIKT